MHLRSFLLDLSGGAGIPSQHQLEVRDISRLLKTQAGGLDQVYLLKHYNRGCFTLQTSNPKSIEFLKTFELQIKVNGRSHLVGLSESLPDRPKTRIRFYGTCSGEMEGLEDTFFDELLKAEGCLIAGTTQKRYHFDSQWYNGQRSALVVRGNQHLERQREWVSPSGDTYKWRLEYDGQPHHCWRGCNTFHEDGTCLKQQQWQERRSWQGQQKCHMVGSSLLRLASDTRNVKVDAIPGAKVGHVANHVNNDTGSFKNAEVLVVVAGANMSYGSIEATKPHLEHQAQEMEEVLAPLVEASTKVFVVDPVPGPLKQEDPSGNHWTLIRSRMRKVAQKTKAHWVSLAGITWKEEEDVDKDEIHYTRAGTRKVLNAIQTRVREVTKKDHFDGMGVQEKPYSGVYSGHWRVGCYRCTRMHPRGTCPPLPTANPGDTINSNITDSFHSTGSNASTIESEEDERPNGEVPLHTCGRGSSPQPPQSSQPPPPLISLDAEQPPWDHDANPIISPPLVPRSPRALAPNSTWADLSEPAPTYAPYVPEMTRSASYTRIPSARSSSAQKRALEANQSATANAAGKKAKTKGDSQPSKEHASRNPAPKNAKK